MAFRSTDQMNLHFAYSNKNCLQCFDAVGWVAGTASCSKDNSSRWHLACRFRLHTTATCKLHVWQLHNYKLQYYLWFAGKQNFFKQKDISKIYKYFKIIQCHNYNQYNSQVTHYISWWVLKNTVFGTSLKFHKFCS